MKSGYERAPRKSKPKKAAQGVAPTRGGGTQKNVRKDIMAPGTGGSRSKKATPGYVRGIPAPVSSPGRKAATGSGGTGHRKGIEAGGLSAEGRTEGLGNLGPPRTPKSVARALHDMVASRRPMYGGGRSSDTYTGS